jgi:hypothetical protein
MVMVLNQSENAWFWLLKGKDHGAKAYKILIAALPNLFHYSTTTCYVTASTDQLEAVAR